LTDHATNATASPAPILVKKRVCFDWCSIQNLFEKTINNEIEIEQITNKYSLILTMMNVHEASVNHNRGQRFAHLGFCHDLFIKNKNVIAEPEMILEKSYYAFKENSSSFNVRIERDVFDFLLNPQKYPENYIPLQKESFQRKNRDFVEMNNGIRNDPRVKNPKKVNSRFSLNEHLSDMFKINDFLNNFFMQKTTELDIKDINGVDGAIFTRNVTPWKIYLCALLTGSYLCGYEQEKLTEPQFTDLQQMIYLPLCDYYITDDGWFLKALKKFIESRFIPFNTQVFDLNQFLAL
jgi:hypothetical protein